MHAISLILIFLGTGAFLFFDRTLLKFIWEFFDKK